MRDDSVPGKRLPLQLTLAALCVLLIGGRPVTSTADDSGSQAAEEVTSDSGTSSATQSISVTPERKRRTSIEEVVVTARRREESLQDTPISVSAFTALDLEDSGIGRADDIGRFTPNLQFDQSAGTQNSARLQIRGVGTGDPIATRDPGVGIYIDGVYLARAQGQLLSLVDIDRVEVLRGPQGTLFGRNTIGGAVNIVTKKPGDEFETSGTLRIGNYDLLESRFSVNVPLVPERAAARFSFMSTTRDGYTKNRLNGQETDDRRLLGGRIALRLNPTDNLEIMLTGEQTRAHTGGRGAECRFVPEALAGAPLIQGANAAAPFLQPFAMNDGKTFTQACLETEAIDELDYLSPIRSKTNLDTWGLGANLTWDLESMTIKSISAWRRQENSSNQDFSFNQFNIGNVIAPTDQQDQVSQEFNLSGVAMGGRLVWTAGLFGFYEKTTPSRVLTKVGFSLCQGLFAAELTAGSPVSDDDLKRRLDTCGASFFQRSGITTNAWAGYGQFTYDVTDRLRLTAGLRRSLERKEYKQDQQVIVSPALFGLPQMLGPVFATNQDERFDKWTPMLNVSFDVAENVMVYATYSKGFKSGGFNGRPSVGADSTLEPFDQEELDNYEIGLKSTWFDKRLVANITLFQNTYEDIQQTILAFDPNGRRFLSRVANAAEADIRGAEVELRATPIPGLDLRAGLGFTDAEYDEFDDTIPGMDAMGNPIDVPVDRSSEDFFNTPAFTATVSAGYTFYDVGGLGDLTARLNWYHQSQVNYGQASDTVEQSKVGLLSGRLSMQLADGRTTLAIFGENLLDRRYINSGINFETGFAVSLGFYGPPRMYGVEIRRNF